MDIRKSPLIHSHVEHIRTNQMMKQQSKQLNTGSQMCNDQVRYKLTDTTTQGQSVVQLLSYVPVAAN